jgi:spore coat protein CotH
MFLAPRVIEIADADGDGRLAPAEAAKVAERLVREAAAGQGTLDADSFGRLINRTIGPPPGPEGEGPPPDDFGPGQFLAPRILEAADADGDGRLTPAEAAKAAETFVAGTVREGRPTLDEDELAQALNRRMGPPPGFGGPGGPMGEDRKLVATFDTDNDGRLDRQERQAARESLKKGDAAGGRPRFRFGPPPGFGGEEEAKPGPRVAKSGVMSFAGKPLYDPTILRTLFLDFESDDWEAELEAFHGTDVEVPATLTVDGKVYPNVGVHFRGMSSYMAVRAGHKRSLNLSLDHVDPDQRLEGSKTLNLLNSHEDPTFLRTVLYFDIARQSIKAPKANLVRLVINGESWGLYVNAQQFDKLFIAENFPETGGKGARWKVRGSPGGRGGLEYVGDDIDAYRRTFEIKSSDSKKDWKALIELCRTLNETPSDRLEAALEPILDIDGALWFLALENALINNDGYWVRASDYSLYRDPRGRFHIIPHDVNETFASAMGPPPFGGPGRNGPPGFGPMTKGERGPMMKKGARGPMTKMGRGPGGPRGGNPDLDPLVGLDDPTKPLRSKLLAVPKLRERYLAHVRTIAEQWLDWERLAPIVARYRSLIEDEVEADTRRLTSFAAFQAAVADRPAVEPPAGRMGLRAFADRRRTFLLDHPEIKELPR